MKAAPAAALTAALALAAVPARAGARKAVESMVLARAQAAGGLDERQAQKLRDAFALYQADVERLRGRFREQMRALDAQVKAKAPDAELQPSLAGLEQTYRDILAQRSKFLEATASFLTPAQRAKIALDLAGKKLKRAP